MFYPEQILVPWAARHLGRTVKWVEDRAEHFVGSHHERLQVHDVSLAATPDGVVVAMRDAFLHDVGAFVTHGINLPLITSSSIAGPYRIPHLEVAFTAVFTNTVPTTPYRGAGRRQACFVVERALDHLADELGIDRIEIRRRNFIDPDAFPYARPGLSNVDGSPVVLDSGDYDAALASVVKRTGRRRVEQRHAGPKPGRTRLGIGAACYVESGGFGPLVAVALYHQPLTLDGMAFVHREVQLRGSVCYTSADFRQAIGLLASGRAVTDPIVTHREPLERLPAVFEMQCRSKDAIKVMIQP
jgi:CO/xanthine dehydrogenase Mo-binding subunit